MVGMLITSNCMTIYRPNLNVALTLGYRLRHSHNDVLDWVSKSNLWQSSLCINCPIPAGGTGTLHATSGHRQVALEAGSKVREPSSDGNFCWHCCAVRSVVQGMRSPLSLSGRGRSVNPSVQTSIRRTLFSKRTGKVPGRAVRRCGYIALTMGQAKQVFTHCHAWPSCSPQTPTKPGQSTQGSCLRCRGVQRRWGS